MLLAPLGGHIPNTCHRRENDIFDQISSLHACASKGPSCNGFCSLFGSTLDMVQLFLPVLMPHTAVRSDGTSTRLFCAEAILTIGIQKFMTLF